MLNSFGVLPPLPGFAWRNEIQNILNAAQKAGLDTLDTAIAYGESETNLGRASVEGWRVISKLPALPKSRRPIVDWLETLVAQSLKRLRIDRLEGLLLHRPADLLGPFGSQLIKGLETQKERGLVSKIGISVYGPIELEELCGRYSFDIVQIPFNIIDRRLKKSGWLKQLTQNGTEIHVRSVFLQGLLLMSPETRPTYFNRWQPLWNRWDSWLADNSISPIAACLSLALSEQTVDRVIVGVDSLQQFQDILAAAQGALPEVPENLCCDDPNLINPSNWQI